MSREIAGKIFYAAEEAEQAGLTPPTEEEIALARRLFDEFQKRMDAVSPDRVKEVSPKFWG
ncbi:hypothetical protein [Mycobacterium lacus]|uniref:Uncharacterized protein n=1 Tax=Mycobacterium lacus TaxID=169765 RepID=A0A7I7NT90_9MYCO|nr:hypothetical protein [Mycobacterium lacus]BBX99011.1 hypothetical protein MLAC_43050 [Mycobacterium lacus]